MARKDRLQLFLALVPFMGLFMVAEMTSTSGVNYLAILAFPSALLVIVLVWFLQRRGTERFRALWKAIITGAGNSPDKRI